MALTAKQLKFIEVYAGNGTDAARLAGYKGTDESLAAIASRLLRLVNVTDAIKSREAKRTSKLIANREERQQFWTKMMRAEEIPEKWRLEASKLLGMSEADFTEKHVHSFSDDLAERMAKARKRMNE